jgi:hypothetical protein
MCPTLELGDGYIEEFTTMTYQETELDSVENIGSFDRANRIVLGITAITVAVVFAEIPESAIISLVAIGMYAGLTAFIGWDPLYALVNAFQPRTPEQTPPTVSATVYQCREEQQAAGGCKKAA